MRAVANQFRGGKGVARASLVISQRRSIGNGMLLHTGYVKSGAHLSSTRENKIRMSSPFSAVVQASALRKSLKPKSGSAAPPSEGAAAGEVEKEDAQTVQWDSKSSADVSILTQAENPTAVVDAKPPGFPKKGRNYVPLSEIAKIELRGDYCLEGGLFQDALQHFGVVAKAFKLAYPENHSQHAHIAVKLGRAFRLTKDLASAEHNFLRALTILDQQESPEVERVAELILEYAQLKVDQNDPEAGILFEDCLAVVTEFHEFGASHRLLKMIPRMGRTNHYHLASKHQWYSFRDWDRTYAIVDLALNKAEAFYRKVGDQAGVIRVLEARVKVTDKKFFNYRTDTGKIHQSSGWWRNRTQWLANASTADEILRYSPTIHQPYRNYALENVAPLTFGEPIPIAQGTNRKVMDDGDPLRYINAEEKERCRTRHIAPTYSEDDLVRW